MMAERMIAKTWQAALTCSLWAIFSLALTGCDWELYHLYNSLPMPDAANPPDPVYVYLAVDGLDLEAAQWAIDEGAYPESRWALSANIPMFPALSPSSWTRILQTEPLPGYEYEYYDAERDKVVHYGDWGIITHIAPPVETVGFETAAYFRAFDHHANGYLDILSIYANPFLTFGQSLDDVFYILDGRTQDSPTFAAYFPQIDILGHSHDPVQQQRAATELWERIEAYRGRHPERRFVFTLFSDHGMNFAPTPPDRLLRLDDEMERLGITVASSLEEWQGQDALAAVPILHSRVTSISLHTLPEQTSAISSLLSGVNGVDLVACRGAAPELIGADQAGLSWYQMWRDEALLGQFAYDRDNDRYLLPRETDWGVFGLDLPPAGGKNLALGLYSDEELFGFSADARYPDMFYRVRMAFEPIGVVWPPQVVISCSMGWVSEGFKLGGGGATDSLGANASHGALLGRGSRGVILTEERSLPRSFRSDNMLEFFPHLREHIVEQRGQRVYPGDAGRGLAYDQVPWD